MSRRNGDSSDMPPWHRRLQSPDVLGHMGIGVESGAEAYARARQHYPSLTSGPPPFRTLTPVVQAIVTLTGMLSHARSVLLWWRIAGAANSIRSTRRASADSSASASKRATCCPTH